MHYNSYYIPNTNETATYIIVAFGIQSITCHLRLRQTSLHMPDFKSFTTKDCCLKKNQVDIWQFSLEDNLSNWQHCLSAEELERAHRFQFQIHKKRFIAAHVLLKKIISLYTHLSPDVIKYRYNKHGKPELVNKPLLQFNLSHSKDLALLAVGYDRPVGIDVEYYSERPYQGIGQHIFSVKENEKLSKMPDMLVPLAFFNLWSQKEAIIKACGLGLSYPTKSLECPILPCKEHLVTDKLHSTQWKVSSFMPEISCMAAVCCHPSVNSIRYIQEPKLL